MSTYRCSSGKRHRPVTVVIGLALIVTCEILLFCVDLPARQWAVVPLPPGQVLEPPRGFWQVLARSVAINITPVCWVGYLLVADGVLTSLARRRNQPSISSIRGRPNRFGFVWLASISVWCYFDWVNFYFLNAWRYHGLPEHALSRYVGYLIAFAAICPGMFLAAQWFNHLGLYRLKTGPVRINRAIQVMVLLLGVVFVIYPFVVQMPVGNLTLWVSWIFLLDPINHWLGVPSIIGDWRSGRWGRTISLMIGGGVCGLCWEFWNYWALAKWTYDLPFIGGLAKYRYFEMPWVGLLGFPAFALECWVVLNMAMALLDRAGVQVVEPLPDEIAVM